MGRVHVPDFESCPFPGEPPRPQGAESPLVRDLRHGVSLVHELTELAGTKKFLDYRDDRFCVYDVVRHRRFKLGEGHLLLYSPLHPHKPDPELILKQLTHSPDAPVTEMIDVIDFAPAGPEVKEVSQNLYYVLVSKHPSLERDVEVKPLVYLETPHNGEVVPLRIEKESFKQGTRILG